MFSRMSDTLNVTLFNDISSIDILNICIITDIGYSIAIELLYEYIYIYIYMIYIYIIDIYISIISKLVS